jgi:TatD DNase family protein
MDTEEEETLLKGADSSPGEASTQVQVRYIDSHFHLDRLTRKYQRGGEWMDCMGETLGDDPFATYTLDGCVASFCDLATQTVLARNPSYLPEILADPRIHLAYGLHPKSALSWLAGDGRQLDANQVSQVRALLSHPRVVAFGEVGMDGSPGSPPWYAQKVALEEILRSVKDVLLERRLPVVIHCREPAAKDGPNVFDGRGTIQGVLQDTVGKDHPIQLHFFTGGASEVEAWHGWNAYFSVPVGLTHQRQQRLQQFGAIPRDRLLLETDAPYALPPGVNRCSTPFDVAKVHPNFASVFGCTVPRLLRITADNARALFRL